MTDFLLELRSEEIPARMQAGARAELDKLFRAQMAAAGIDFDDLTIWSTPRRLALIARDLPEATAAVSEELKGPRTSAPPQALEGFLRKTGLTQEQLEDRDGIWFAVIDKPGRATADVLAEAIPIIVRSFAWPKSMRWGKASVSSESMRWVRPLSGVIAIFGEEVVETSLDMANLYGNNAGDIAIVPGVPTGLTTGRTTRGHRFHCPGDITIGSASDYAEKLRACHVIVDHEERANIIRDGAAKAAADAGLSLVADEGLVIENAGLTEWPVPLLGRFDEAFLEVPPEVIQLTARVNQKYFVVNDSAGKLANGFVCTANIAAVDGGEEIVAGNRKVLAARLSDARFFWDQDRKTRLADHAKKLDRITFHEKLGTVADKVERVAKLAEWLASEGIVPNCDPALARQAAELAKTDLVTEMVGEFPELQGLMGGYYAHAEGLPDAVADAIRDHYKPVGQGDDVPTAPVTVAVALADKLDTVSKFFEIGELPTGSKDPFALRRAAIAVSRIVEANEIRLPLWPIIAGQIMLSDGSSDMYAIVRQKFWSRTRSEIHQEYRWDLPHERFPDPLETLPMVVDGLLGFFADRLKVQQREAGVRHDLIDAVFALGGEDDLVRLLARVKALQAFMATDDGANLLAGYKRAANILKQAGEVSPSRFREGLGEGMSDAASDDTGPPPTPPASGRGEVNPAETALLAALDAAAPAAAAAVADERFTDAMSALASLRAPIDAFFEGVMINDPDAAVRAYRLGLLARFTAAVHGVADFSKIEG